VIGENFLEENLPRIFDCNMWPGGEAKTGYEPGLRVYSANPDAQCASLQHTPHSARAEPLPYYAYNFAPLMEIEHTIDFFIRHRAAAVRLFPKKMNYSLAGTETEAILCALEERRLPLMVWHTETTWAEIDAVCGRHPGLPVIIDGSDKKLLYHNRVYIPLLLKHPNLYLETYNFIQYMGYEALVNKYKIDRLVFGTNYPANSPLAPLYMLLSADIPETAKEKILNGNMKRLVSGIKLDIDAP